MLQSRQSQIGFKVVQLSLHPSPNGRATKHHLLAIAVHNLVAVDLEVARRHLYVLEGKLQEVDLTRFQQALLPLRSGYSRIAGEWVTRHFRGASALVGVLIFFAVGAHHVKRTAGRLKHV